MTKLGCVETKKAELRCRCCGGKKEAAQRRQKRQEQTALFHLDNIAHLTYILVMASYHLGDDLPLRLYSQPLRLY